MLYLTWAWRNGWANNRDARDLRRYRADYDVIVMYNPGASIDYNEDTVLLVYGFPS